MRTQTQARQSNSNELQDNLVMHLVADNYTISNEGANEVNEKLWKENQHVWQETKHYQKQGRNWEKNKDPESPSAPRESMENFESKGRLSKTAT